MNWRLIVDLVGNFLPYFIIVLVSSIAILVLIFELVYYFIKLVIFVILGIKSRRKHK